MRIIYINLSSENKYKILFGEFIIYYMKFLFIYPNYILRSILTFGNTVLDIFNNAMNSISFEFIPIKPLKLIDKHYNRVGKFTQFTFENNKLLDHKYLFAALFASLISHDEFEKIGKKILIVSISKEEQTFHIHKNIIIDENTSISNYLDKIENHIQAFYESGYPITTFNVLHVKLWDYNFQSRIKGQNTNNSIHKFGRSFHNSSLISNNKDLNLISPLKTPKVINKISIAAIDLETVKVNNDQLPVSISFSYIFKGEIKTIFELIDLNQLLENPDKAIGMLWLNFMNRLNNLNLHKCVIFSHNLGSFDGYFIFKGLLGLPNINLDKVNSIIDDFHRFINIDIIFKDSKFIFKDSIRIFPISLQDLCDIFDVEGKLHAYNPEFNKLTLFDNPDLLNQFTQYAKQDSISLLKALLKAQHIYITEYEVDIASVWSTSTLSLKIFRQRFLKTDIPILSNKLDDIIRLSYIGGSTDYYIKYGEGLKHYDVNSLYPKAMCNPMPLEFLGESIGGNVKLEDSFGFVEARITTPDDLTIPLLPFKVENETLHPLGSWMGIYFSE